VAFWYVLAAHSLQAGLPVPSWYEPAGHSMQVVWPARFWNWPVGQLMHMLVAVLSAVPATQTRAVLGGGGDLAALGGGGDFLAALGGGGDLAALGGGGDLAALGGGGDLTAGHEVWPVTPAATLPQPSGTGTNIDIARTPVTQNAGVQQQGAPYGPVAHAWQAVVRPVASLYVLAAHSLQAALPVVSWYEPAGQGLQAVWPS
jgi:hypothetical protein